MKHHEIKLEDLQKWFEEQEQIYANSTRENKRLTVTCKGTFKLIVGNEVIWQGMQPHLAVEKYNSITEKWVNPLKDFKI